MPANRHRSPTARSRRSTATAWRISAAVNGSRGWPVLAGLPSLLVLMGSIMSRAHRRGAVGMERADRLQAPGLALGPLGLAPADRLPVRGEDQPGHRVAQLDPVPARLVDVEEERLLDGVLVRPGLDEHPVVQADVGSAQDVLTGVGGE